MQFGIYPVWTKKMFNEQFHKLYTNFINYKQDCKGNIFYIFF